MNRAVTSYSLEMPTIHMPSATSARFGETLLVMAEPSDWDAAAAQADAAGLHLELRERLAGREQLYLVIQEGRGFQRHHPDVPLLLDHGRYLAVALDPDQRAAITDSVEAGFALRPIETGDVIFDMRDHTTDRAAPLAWVQRLLGRLQPESFAGNLAQLASYPTRLSASTHYADAAAWVRAQLAGLGYATSITTVLLAAGSTCNVVADRPGRRSGARDLVLLTAHLDSINAQGGSTASAPGADDNASGCAGLIELARVLRDHRASHDLRLVFFGGEEQGLYGSRQYVAALPAADRARLRAVINMDMIGVRNTPAPTVLLEGAPISQALIDALASAAATYTVLNVQTSLHPFGSDHIPFIEAGLPAALTIEGADSANQTIHTADDTADRIDQGLAIEILRMNLAAASIALGREETDMNGITIPDITPYKPPVIPDLDKLRAPFGGRYVYRGPELSEDSWMERAGIGHGIAPRGQRFEQFEAVVHHPLDPETLGKIEENVQQALNRLHITLRIDIDGPDPLNVVSGTVRRGLYLRPVQPAHFIGRITSDTTTSGRRELVVEDLSFYFVRGPAPFVRIEISLHRRLMLFPTARVTFVTDAQERYGPYEFTQESGAFEDVEVEIDAEDHAVACEPYNTHTHPDRPADLPEEELTLEEAYKRAGIAITRSPNVTTINTSEAKTENKWNERELHDAMEVHWSRFANIPQWRLWIFLAEQFEGSDTGGIMFDANINDPGGVDRQGTAIFTRCAFYHHPQGAYCQANPPADAAAKRERFFDLIHESGHAFNLAHSWEKTLGKPWTPPPWMPIVNEPLALSWMNYPEVASGQATNTAGFSAKWFYDRFYFRFSPAELLFMRHAPRGFVQMGNEDWAVNHGRAAPEAVDPRLELALRTQTPAVELGTPVFIELRLKNIGDAPLAAHGCLSPDSDLVRVAITNPRGERQPFLPFIHVRAAAEPQHLAPGQALYQAINLTMGLCGFAFKEPGIYRIEASYTNLDGGMAAGQLQIEIRPPADPNALPIVRQLFNARVGRVLYVGGTRLMEDVNETIDRVRERLRPEHPAVYYLDMVRAMPYARPYKIVDAEARAVRVLPPDLEFVEQRLRPVVERPAAAADALGHITYRRAVDTYTDVAIGVGRVEQARMAQQRMLDLFTQRRVAGPVIAAIRDRIARIN